MLLTVFENLGYIKDHRGDRTAAHDNERSFHNGITGKKMNEGERDQRHNELLGNYREIRIWIAEDLRELNCCQPHSENEHTERRAYGLKELKYLHDLVG